MIYNIKHKKYLYFVIHYIKIKRTFFEGLIFKFFYIFLYYITKQVVFQLLPFTVKKFAIIDKILRILYKILFYLFKA